MTSFVGKGTDIARALDNALLFCDAKAEYLPGVVLVELSMTHVTFSACDDYATGRDFVGDPGASLRQGTFEIGEEEASELVKLVRSAKTKAVMLDYDLPAEIVDCYHLVVTVGDMVTRFMLRPVSDAWDDILPLIDVDTHEPERTICCDLLMGLPATVAFNAARFARFGRVKALKDAPMDIRFHATDGAPVALVKIGPTFRGEIQGLRREEAFRHLGDAAADCFW